MSRTKTFKRHLTKQGLLHLESGETATLWCSHNDVEYKATIIVELPERTATITESELDLALTCFRNSKNGQALIKKLFGES